MSNQEQSILSIAAKVAIELGYAFCATDKDGKTFLYEKKPERGSNEWFAKSQTKPALPFAAIDFGTHWNDESPLDLTSVE